MTASLRSSCQRNQRPQDRGVLLERGLPTGAILDLGATSGINMKLIGHADAVSKLSQKYGPTTSPE